MIYILRHGKTDWNKRKKLQGDVCYSSPLSRARETAEIILKDRNVPIIFDDRLIEMAFGKYEGIERSFDIPGCPINILFEHPEEYIAPEDAGESLDDLYKRTGSFLDEVIRPLDKAGKDVLIVAHGALNSCMLTQAKGLPRKDFWSHGIVQCRLMPLFGD